MERVHRDYPDLILQNCGSGAGRSDLGMAARFHETFTTDGLWMPHVLSVHAGESVALPPETFFIHLGAVREKALGRPTNFDTYLRCAFSFCTPQILSGMVASGRSTLDPQRAASFVRYARLYKEFVRPLQPLSRVFHHAPVSARGGVTDGPWYAMEFACEDRLRGWATIVRVGDGDQDGYVFRPRGLDPAFTYEVTFDSKRSTAHVAGWRLVSDGIRVRLDALIESELLLFRAITDGDPLDAACLGTGHGE